MFFTDTNFPYLLNYTGPNDLPNAVWRYDDETKSLIPVIGRADIPDPNGVAVNKESTRLYVTDTPVSYLEGAGPGKTTGSAAIYVFDLNEDLVPINKRLFGFSRARAPDGMKVDVLGRVWTAEGEGVVVRNSTGKVLGVFNSEVLADDAPTVSNFALVNNRLIILAETSIWSVTLGQLVEQ
jgi:gluconolactonase